MEFVYLNGRLVDSAQAHVSVHDAGLLHGVGLFETMRSYGGRTFRLAEHLDRLYRSAGQLGIRIRHGSGQLGEWVAALLEANDLQDARLRLTVTRGNVQRADPDDEPSSEVFLTAGPMTPYPPEYYRRGMTVMVSDYKANPAEPTAGHKTLNYFSRLLMLQEAQKKQAGEALWFTPANRLASGCVSNVFVVRGGVLLTPPAEKPVLPGITRRTVLDLARDQGIVGEQRWLTIQELLGADEVFLTNSIMELMPVCRIERHAVGQDKPGPVYTKLHEAYRQLVRAECGSRPPQQPTAENER